MLNFDAQHQSTVIRQMLLVPEAPELLRSLLSDFTEEQKAQVRVFLFPYETDLVRRYLKAKDELTELGRQTAARWSSDDFRDCVPELRLPSRKPYQPPVIPGAEEVKQRLLAAWDKGLLNTWVMEFTATERALVIPLLTPQQKKHIEELESSI